MSFKFPNDNIINCGGCKQDIFSLLEKDPDRDNLLNIFIQNHVNKNLVEVVDGAGLRIKYIPEKIKNVLIKEDLNIIYEYE